MGQLSHQSAMHRVETDAFIVEVDGLGIVRVAIKKDSIVSEASSRVANRAIRELVPRLPARILADITAPHEALVCARRYGASQESIEVTGRLALLTRSPVARMAGNGFLFVRRPPFPTRLFTEESLALRWLMEADNE